MQQGSDLNPKVYTAIKFASASNDRGAKRFLNK
jgi:hypothetical protein